MPQAPLLNLPASENVPNIERECIEETRLTHEELTVLVNEGVISTHPRVVSGAFVFTGTRVPVYNLWDYLAAGDSLEEFLDSFPTVPRTLAEKATRCIVPHSTV